MKSIMIIDDEPLVRSMLEQMLKREGYEVVTAEHGNAAMNLLRQTDKLPGLIITDLIMPYKEGLELIPEIKAAYPEIRIIAFSGGSKHIDPDTQLDIAACLGADKRIAKPAERHVMLEAVRELLS
ncbi:response regulator [Prosthecochloris sp. HL-130-GSB]|jgi:CheY-like chemotaxis protein|uniref:Response regulator n=1 Tax=Prosthecochloris aestuarii TaxID=1102 RepID=A0A831WVG7_PROAE|nr:response regulator [Prosthecochloris sp. HL-130-GSB]ARM31775.1 hypothetical protein B9H02_11335 [Prosthecochloris sp. HL-130-GSB]MBO8092409.1 response regulator [Prosthecochloris sp.]HED31601.1 response regulator [Prosthecochloris aestuarii]